MPFSPSSKAQAIVTQIGSNMASAGQSALQTSVSGGNTAPGGFVDGVLSGIGYQANHDAAATGFSNGTTSFANVFSSAPFTIPLTTTYLLHVDLSCYASVAAGLVTFQTTVDTAPTTILSAQKFYFNSANVHVRISWRQPLDLTAGSRVFQLQWKTDGVATVVTDANDFRCFTITG